jgi:hypothetical protein
MQQQNNSTNNGTNGGVAISTTNKLVYISRVEGKYDERDIISIIQSANIGRVRYADLTAVKDNSPDAGPNPAFKFYSAFVMMSEWNPAALADLKQFGQVKVWVDSNRTVYWLLRPATEGSEIPRSKVNTHQLAHYTAELYVRSSATEKKAEEQAITIEDHSTRLKDLYDTVAFQAKIIEDQNERFAHMLETMEMMLVKNEKMANTFAKTAIVVSYMDAFMTKQFVKAEAENESTDL